MKKYLEWYPVAFICILFCTTMTSFAAGFDCSKATSAVENLICNDKELNLLDESNTNLYYEVKKTKPAIAVDQKDWLKNTRNKCVDKTCLLSTYVERNKQLEGQLNGGRASAQALASKEKILSLVQELANTTQNNAENIVTDESVSTQESAQVETQSTLSEQLNNEPTTPVQEVDTNTPEPESEQTEEQNEVMDPIIENGFLNNNAKLFGGILTLIIVMIGLLGLGNVFGLIIGIPVLIALAISSKKDKKDETPQPKSSTKKVASSKSKKS